MAIAGDFSELHRLVIDLDAAAARVLPEVREVIQRGSLNIKNEMIADAKGSPHFRSLASTISYDTEVSLRGEISAEIGPDRGRGGAAGLAGAYFGWPGGGGGTLDIDKPLRSEEPRLLKALGDLGKGLIR